MKPTELKALAKSARIWALSPAVDKAFGGYRLDLLACFLVSTNSAGTTARVKPPFGTTLVVGADAVFTCKDAALKAADKLLRTRYRAEINAAGTNDTTRRKHLGLEADRQNRLTPGE